LSEGIDLYAKLVEQNVEVLKIIEEDGSQWRILQEQLVRNQDDIKRLFRDLDSKTQSLKLSAAEVINVKRKIRNIKKDNLALREEVEKAGQFEPEIFLNRPELMAMDDEEVRNKIISIAKAYRDERVRNKNLMKTLKMAQKDIADRTKVLANLKKIEESTNEITGQMAVMAHEFGKVGSYRETINKQEAMILRLEGILKTMAKQSKEVRVGADNFSKEIEENEKLRNNIQVYKVPDNHGQYAQYKEVVKKLEKEITQLQAELVSNRPVSAYKAKQVGDRAAKEVLLDRANARSFALEQQISGNTTNYAQQIAVLKSKIAEKDAMLKAISKEF
jgi:chromosome segregation ATPase